MPSSLGAISEGLWSSIDQTRKENRDREDQRSRLEQSVLSTLLQADNPQVRAMAIGGLLDAASPKRRLKGMRGFLDEFETNPALQDIHKYLTTPETTVTPGLPSRGIPVASAMQAPAAPPSRGAAALPEAGHMVGVPPPPTAGSAFTQERATPAVGRTDTSYPQAFLDPNERMRRAVIAKSQGDVEGDIAGWMATGLSREAAIKQVQAERVRAHGGVGGAGFLGQVQGSMLPEGTMDAFGRPVDPDQTYRGVGGQYYPVVTAGPSMGADNESVAQATFGQRFGALHPDQQQQVLDEVARRKASIAAGTTAARGEASAQVPLSTSQRADLTLKLSGVWDKASAANRLMNQQFQLMQTGLSRYDADPIGASQAVLVTFQKILDPTSVVRESEYARSPQGLSLMDWMQGMVDKYGKGGAGVPKPVLAQMVETARQFLGAVKDSNEGVKARISRQAASYGIPAEDVLGGDAGVAGGGVGAPPPGPGGSAQPSPQQTAAPALAKTTDMARVRAWAAQKGMTEQEAIADIEGRGYAITDKP